MRLELSNAELNLLENQPLALVNGKGGIIHCTGGIAWLTVEGEPGDFLLRPGMSHRLESDGLALVEGMGQASIRLEPARCRLISRGLELFRRMRPSTAPMPSCSGR